MTDRELECLVESILFASGDPVPVKRLCAVLEVYPDVLEAAISRLAGYYAYERRGIGLVRLEDSIQLCTRPEYGEYIRKALETRRNPSLTPTALEVLSIIAYRQPVTRLQIESIRGVDSSYTISSLVEKGLIEECGKLDVPGRPNLYRTTGGFLRSFGLSSITDLPELETDLGEQLAMADLDAAIPDNTGEIGIDSLMTGEEPSGEE